MTTTIATEKRKHARIPMGTTLDIAAKGTPAGKCRGTIADLSAGGMTFKTNAELEAGMVLHLKVNAALEIRGEVTSIKGSHTGGLHRYGVRFHKVGYTPEKFIAAKLQK